MRSALISAVFASLLPAVAAGQEPPWHPSADDFDSSPVRLGSPVPIIELPPGHDDLFPDAPPPALTAPSPWVSLVQSRFMAAWLPGSGNHLGFTDFDLRSTLALGETGVTMTPGVGLHLVDGPRRTDLPPQLYDFYFEVAWMKQLSRRFGMELAITPGLYTDFDNLSGDAFRLIGRAVGFFGLTYTVQFAFGVAYLDRDDIPALPIVGVIYAPSETVRYELIFPRPRIATRIGWSEQRERWVYLLGEFGGGAWGIEREWGADDQANYRDWRLIGGLETKYAAGRSWLLEAGYVFSRRLEYRSGIGDFGPASTAMLRTGLVF